MLRIALALTLLALPATAADWSCRNELAEITCAEGACAQAESFTPMELGFADAGGPLSVCAYSGCWEGGVSTRIAFPDVLLLMAQDLRWTASPDTPGPVAAVIFDRAARVAMLRIGDYALPMGCTAR